MENASNTQSNMLRRKTISQIRKYSIVFFGLLLIFIWINHYNGRPEIKADVDAEISFPSVRDEPVTSSTNINRAQRLYELAKKHNVRERPIPELWGKQGLGMQENVVPKPDVFAEDNDNEVPNVFKKQPSVQSTLVPARYFVKSHKCKMPYADPFSRGALENYHPPKLKTCTNESDLFRLDFDMSRQQYKLQVNAEIIRNLAPQVKQFGCNYRQVTRSSNATADSSSDIQPPVSFLQNIFLDRNITGLIVECHDAHNASIIIQQDAFPLVQVPERPPVNKKPKIPQPPKRRQPSVILLGLDSMSRMNFKRTMPLTSSWVHQLGWYEMEGYNKLADNTLPNLMPVLTGLKLNQLDCGLRTRGCLDSLPWIWNDYKNAGYRTAFAEDIIDQAVFDMGLSGFVNEPVDHYLRPFFVGINKAMRIYSRFGYQYCIGRRLSIGYVYDFCRQFTQRYIEQLDEPVFGFFWSCTFTHDFYFGAASLDAKFLEYLKILEGHQLFERSIVILFSDHGARFGDLMELSDGFLEERLPMLHIYLPPWFRTAYPKYSQALHLNRNRLSSNYDLHNTLRHILQLNASSADDLPLLDTCRTSQSLLHPLPRERSCSDACIPEHWCTCNEYITQPLNVYIYQLGKLMIYHINRWMLQHKFNQKCQRLLLLDIDHAEHKVLFEDMGKESMYGAISIYRLRFRTNPPEGKFQITVRFNRDIQDFDKLDVADISRLNSYHNDSYCVSDKIAKKFCFCYPSKIYGDMINWQEMVVKKKKVTINPN